MQKMGNVSRTGSLGDKPFHPALKKYFWDHTGNASDVFKLRRLLEYASFPDLLKIPFEFVKANIHAINPQSLRTSETRRRFTREIRKYIQTSSNWDETLFKIAGIDEQQSRT